MRFLAASTHYEALQNFCNENKKGDNKSGKDFADCEQ
jgi:hypothetical protein